MKYMERRYHRHMRRLAHRIFFCFLITLGVCLCWLASLVRLEFLLMVGFVCACIVAFSVGSGQEKRRQFGGERR